MSMYRARRPAPASAASRRLVWNTEGCTARPGFSHTLRGVKQGVRMTKWVCERERKGH